MTHIGQYHIWKRSIKFRFYLETIFTILLTFFFLYYIADFNKRLHLGVVDLEEMTTAKDLGEDYSQIKSKLLEDVDIMVRDFNGIFYLTVPIVLFPIHVFLRWFFSIRTKRFDAANFSLINYTELGLFILIALWELEKYKFKNRKLGEDD
jgi:Na+/H+ antiporter NhaC